MLYYTNIFLSSETHETIDTWFQVTKFYKHFLYCVFLVHLATVKLNPSIFKSRLLNPEQ